MLYEFQVHGFFTISHRLIFVTKPWILIMWVSFLPIKHFSVNTGLSSTSNQWNSCSLIFVETATSEMLRLQFCALVTIIIKISVALNLEEIFKWKQLSFENYHTSSGKPVDFKVSSVVICLPAESLGLWSCVYKKLFTTLRWPSIYFLFIPRIIRKTFKSYSFYIILIHLERLVIARMLK